MSPFGKELLPGITAVDARGHAPGHAGFVIASGNARLLYIADATNNPALFARNPDWHLWADMNKAAAVATRKRLFDMAMRAHADLRLPPSVPGRRPDREAGRRLFERVRLCSVQPCSDRLQC